MRKKIDPACDLLLQNQNMPAELQIRKPNLLNFHNQIFISLHSHLFIHQIMRARKFPIPYKTKNNWLLNSYTQYICNLWNKSPTENWDCRNHSKVKALLYQHLVCKHERVPANCSLGGFKSFLIQLTQMKIEQIELQFLLAQCIVRSIHIVRICILDNYKLIYILCAYCKYFNLWDM